jgi:hypothetical protein
MKAYREAIRNTMDPEALGSLFTRLVGIATGAITTTVVAKSGNVADVSPTFKEQIAASKLVLEYVVGKPEQVSADNAKQAVNVTKAIFVNEGYSPKRI